MQFNIGTAHLTAGDCERFRREWVHPVPGERTLASLRRMDPVVTAVDERDGVVGFVCGFTDRVLIAYVWDLEVLPAYRDRGLEHELVERFVAACGEIYQVNAHPHAGAVELFERVGFRRYEAGEAIAMTIQKMELQAG